MARRTLGLNKYQRAARKPGERRVGREDIQQLLEWSRSDDAAERVAAAQYLCPCHVRRRIGAVWEALYRMLEDPDVAVRRSAWHTLEDGGRPDDPALDEIIARALQSEADPVVRRYAEQFARSREEKEAMARELALRSEYTRRGKCDFCGKRNVHVKADLDTTIPSGGHPRAALVCRRCAESPPTGRTASESGAF